MTTITIDRRLLEQALAAIQELEYASTAVSDKKARDAKQSIRSALAAPATAPEQLLPFVPWSKEAEMVASWTATAPAQPAWHDAPTCAGLWLSDNFEGISTFNSDDLQTFQTSAGVRWFGPIPEDKP